MELKTRKVVDHIADVFNIIYRSESMLAYKCKVVEQLMIELGYTVEVKPEPYYADTKTANKFAHDVMVILAKDQSDKEN